MSEAQTGRWLVWAVVASQFAPPFMFSGVAVALPSLGHELGASASELGLMETLFLAGSTASLLPLGRLADGSDKRSLYTLGLVAFGVLSLALGAMSFMPGMLIARFAQGTAAASFTVSGPAIIAELVPAERRGRAYGASLGAVYGGLTLGPVCAGLLVEAWGWRSVFFAGGGALLAMGLAMRAVLGPRWRRPTASVHVPSAALMLGAVLACVLGAAWLRAGLWGGGLLVAGVGGGVGFVALQLRLPRPLLDLRALGGNRVLRDALLIQGLLYMNAFAALFMASLFIQVTLGQPADRSGQVMALGSVVMAVLAPLSGRLADRISPRLLTSVGAACVLASSMIALSLDETSSLTHIGAVLVFQSAGFACFSSPNMSIIMGSVPAAEVGMASALGAKARAIGMLAGMIVTGALISLHYGSAPISSDPAAFVLPMTWTWTILAVAVGLAFLVSVWSMRR